MSQSQKNIHIIKYLGVGFLVVLAVITPNAMHPVSMVLLTLSAYLAYKWHKSLRAEEHIKHKYTVAQGLVSSYEDKYKDLIDTEIAIKELNQELSAIKDDIAENKKKLTDYSKELDLIDIGYRKSHFNLDSCDAYKQKIEKVKLKQKELLSGKLAVRNYVAISIDGSREKGREVANKIIKLTTRAFNKECEIAIANLDSNNLHEMQMRIEQEFEFLNNLNKDNHIVITTAYLKLKLDELYLVYECQEQMRIEGSSKDDTQEDK